MKKSTLCGIGAAITGVMFSIAGAVFSSKEEDEYRSEIKRDMLADNEKRFNDFESRYLERLESESGKNTPTVY